MDIKGSARSKHALSQCGRARHSNHKRSLVPVLTHQDQSASNSKSLPLPSNWTRYEEEETLEVKPLNDRPSVKSKGLDYRELLMQRSSTSNSENADWTGGRRSLMITRGLDLLSQGLEADTLWSRKETSADEASFLSLDLDFLGKELANLDLAERLLIDPKFIPVEKRKKSSSIKCEDYSTEAQNANQQLLESAMSAPEWTVPENYLMALSMPSRVLGLDISLSKPSVSETHPVLDDLLDTSFMEDSSGGQPESSKPVSTAVATQEVTYSMKMHAHIEDTATQPLMSSVSKAYHVLDDLSSTSVTKDFITAQPESPKSTSERAALKGVIDCLQTDETEARLKETTMQLRNVDHLKLEAKAAEADLDALLDMLDHHHLEGSATDISRTFPGSVIGEGPTSVEVGHSEAPEQASYANLNNDAFFGTLKSSLESQDTISFNANQSSKQGTMSSVAHSGKILSLSTAQNGKGALDLDEDFDKWLDTL